MSKLSFWITILSLQLFTNEVLIFHWAREIVASGDENSKMFVFFLVSLHLLLTEECKMKRTGALSIKSYFMSRLLTKRQSCWISWKRGKVNTLLTLHWSTKTAETLKYQNSRNKHLSIWNISPFVIWTGKGKQTGETAESQETAPPKKTRKIFDKVELASLDAVYQASNGLPTNSMVERLAHSLDITKNQVIIPSSWTLYSAWFKLSFRLWSSYVVFII